MNAKLEPAAVQLEIDDRLRTIFMEQYGLMREENDPGYKAWGLMGVEVAMCLANVFLLLKDAKTPGRAFKAVCDLSYVMNTNEFWVKNAGIILPVVHMALNAHRDHMLLAVDRQERDQYALHDGLMYAAMYAPLEVFTVIAYCLGGPALQANISTTLKLALQPYFRS